MHAMIKGRDAFITGIGSYSPGEPVPYDRIEEVLGPITDAPPKVMRWIERMRPIMKDMLGMESYHYAVDPATRKPTEDNVSMGVTCAEKALAEAGIDANGIDLLVYAGVVMENLCPPTSVLIQEKLGIATCADLAIHSNCTSIYKAIQVASDLVANGRYDNALIVTSQLSSPFLRAEHYNQKIIEKNQIILRWFLCDGAGALVITANPDQGRRRLRVVDTYTESVGLGLGPDMYCLAGGQRINPLETYEHGWHHLTQDFENVGKLGLRLSREAVEHMVAKTGIDPHGVKYFFANIPTRHLNDLFVEDVKKVLGLEHLIFYTRLGDRGYPGPCAIVIALDEFFRETTPDVGDVMMSVVAESSKWMFGGFVLEYLGPPAYESGAS